MPTYSYRCTACDHLIEKRQSFSDPPLTTCDLCGGPLRKIIHPVGIVFKGTGWYVTDSRSASNGRGGESTSKSTSESATTTTAKDSGASKDTSASTTSTSSKSG